MGSTLLLLNERHEAAVEAAFNAMFLRDDPGYREVMRGPEVLLKGPWTSVVSGYSRGFHHWMFDVLPRLALLPELPAATGVLVPEKLDPYQLDTLRWLGLDGRFRPTAESNLVIEQFYFSSPPAITGCFNPYGVEFLRRSFLPRADATFVAPSKVYIRRVGVSRGIINEAEVIALVEARGWVVLDMAALTLSQQIQVFAHADAICGLHGAAFTNLVFCQPGTRVLELLADTFLNGVYEGISEAAGLRYDFLVCRGDAEFRAWVDLAELGKRLPQ